MSSKNRLIIAAAGSGKTTFLVKSALEKKAARVLITTYTQASEEQLRRKFYELNNCIPNNVTIQPWFSFLLQHGVRPLQGILFKGNITGLFLYNGQSAQYVPEANTEKHYFTKDGKIYSDKISKFVVKCNAKYHGAIIDRLIRVYSDIFIDEIQDLAGYDLEFLNLLFEANVNTLLVCDPRQATYSTNSAAKNKQFAKSDIIGFLEGNSSKIEIDDLLLRKNYRSNQAICNLSNRLYPHLVQTHSGNTKTTGHDGVFFIRKDDIIEYLEKYKPVQLRWNVRTKVNENYRFFNFGASKGLEFDRVLIYPTSDYLGWLENNDIELHETSRAKFYVALTRARFSVGIVCDRDEINVEGIELYRSSKT